MVEKGLKGSLDSWSTLLVGLTFEGFGVITPLVSQSGQCRTDHDVDPTIRGDPEYPHIYDSCCFMSEKWIMV
jgi:hypothetical protein